MTKEKTRLCYLLMDIVYRGQGLGGGAPCEKHCPPGCCVTVQAELAQDERQAAELAGVTWQPEISKMAQTLQRRDADEDSFMRLTRTRTNKTQVILLATSPKAHLYRHSAVGLSDVGGAK